MVVTFKVILVFVSVIVLVEIDLPIVGSSEVILVRLLKGIESSVSWVSQMLEISEVVEIDVL